MPDYIAYHKSISTELISMKDRVRYFIKDKHYGEDGRYKETILMSEIQKHLPTNVAAGTGFIIREKDQNHLQRNDAAAEIGTNNDEEDPFLSTQVDIIIYRTDVLLMFKQGDFVIVPEDGVLGIIEVKTKLDSSNLKETLEKNDKIGQMIGRRIFNGVFAYEIGTTLEKWCYEEAWDKMKSSFVHGLKEKYGVNYICLGKDIFIKHWAAQKDVHNTNDTACYKLYDMNDLAFGYFISNLLEDVVIELGGKSISKTLQKWMYPIQPSKKVFEQYVFTSDVNDRNGEDSECIDIDE